MRNWINLFENQLLPEIVYHGTNLRAWNEQADHDEPLYLTNDREEAESHAERTYAAHHDHEDPEYKDPSITPIVVEFRTADLMDAGLNFQPDWGWDMADENTTWQQSLAAVGSFCIEGFAQSHKALGKVSAAFPETFPLTLAEADHTEPTWRYEAGGDSYGLRTTARVVKGSFKVKDDKSATGEWPYGYSFVFARNGEVEVSFYLDAANYFGRDLHLAAEAGKITHEKAKELSIRQLSDGMGIYNMMGANVARTVLRVMGDLIQRFVKEYDPPVLMMVAKTERRLSIYERMLKQLPGYEISHEPDPRGNGYLVYAKKIITETDNHDHDPVIDEITQIVGSVSDPIEGVWLYGSRAKGTARPDSDYDVLVIADIDEDDIDYLQDELHGMAESNIEFLVTTPALADDPSTIAHKARDFGIRLL